MTTTVQTASTTSSTDTPRAIAGLHHVTAITAVPQENIDFYTQTLGLRLVKVTINYDDPGTYHLYYGDGLGRPGTIMTHFAWPGARRGISGVGQVSETAFAIPTGSAAYWQERLAGRGVLGVELTERFGQKTVTFVDPDGMALALVETPVTEQSARHWPLGGVPAEHAIRGFFGVTLAEATDVAPATVLVSQFGYRETGRTANRVRYEATGDAPARTVDVVIVPRAGFARMGAGQVHHVAFRTPDDAQQAAWLELLQKSGRNVSPVMNRDYFRSIYFREPGGVLFEIATDGPGMTINERAEALGTRVQLPGWLEAQRAEVEAMLPKLRLAEPVATLPEEV